ncbi:MAG: tetratricopeptide repeat protein [Lachnospiraceae bacterium]|nr:tetratricopeptide repeat protein [Lachnospiraceae bacterium]
MKGKRNYEQELLEWKEHQFELRVKYRDTPAGFGSGKLESLEKNRLTEARTHYQESHISRLLTENFIHEEIFVGREDILKQIEEAFAAGSGPVILYGMGGIGKSAIAREYLRRKQQDYDHTLLLYGDNGIQSAICDDNQVRISNLQYTKDEYSNRNNYFRKKIRTLTQIARERRLLLIIDDWNREKDRGMSAVLALPCDIIVTTRIHPDLWGLKGGILVSGFTTQEEWDQFLCAYGNEHRSEEETQRLYSYCRQVGGHTLLMKLMAVQTAPQDTEAGEETVLPVSDSGSAEDILTDLFSRFTLHQEEKQALRELSIMPVKGIPLSLYLKISRVTLKALKRLETFLLINRSRQGDDAVLSLHPLIAEAARRLFTPTLTNCRSLVANFCNAQWDMWENTYAENQKMEPYVFAIIRAFPQPVSWFAIELERLTTWLWIQEYYGESERWQKKIVDCVEKDFGTCHQLTGEMYLRMAAACYNSMDVARANPWYEKAYETLNLCKPYDSRYLRLLSEANMKLSRRYLSEGCMEKAVTYAENGHIFFRKYMQHCEKRGITHPYDTNTETVWQSHRLRESELLFLQGKTDEALAMCEDSKAAMRNIPGTEIRLNEYNTVLIRIYQHKGDFAHAEALAKENIERNLVYRSPYFKDTLMCREQLGDLYVAAGRMKEAAQEYETLYIGLSEHFPARPEWVERVKKKLLAAMAYTAPEES